MNSTGLKKSGIKSFLISAVKTIAFSIVVFIATVILGAFKPFYSAALALLIAGISLFRPVPELGANRASGAFIALLCVVMLSLGVAERQQLEKQRVAALRLNSPDEYLLEVKRTAADKVWLAELRELRPMDYLRESKSRISDVAWLEELRVLDPDGYQTEVGRREAERARVEAEVAARQKEDAEKKKQEAARLADLRRRDPKAYLAAIQNHPGYLDELQKLDPAAYKRKLQEQKEEDRRQALVGMDVELMKWNWSREHGYVTVEGQVRNVSGRSLRNVTALVSIYDKAGGFVTSEDALIEFNPILPGQISPFKILARWNPAMARANVTFKFLLGGELKVYHPPKS